MSDTTTPAKKKPGRPKVVLNMAAILDLAADGFSNTRIMRALSIPANVWARRLRDEVGFRDTLNRARATTKADILKAQKREALSGKVGPARMLLELLDEALP
jgi:hypothetical protein